MKWKRSLEGGVTPGPVVGKDGTIYTGSNGGILHAIDPATGKDEWTFDSHHSNGTDLSVSPLILPDGTILWPTPGPELIALSPAGTKLWSVTLPGNPTSPASFDGKRVYVGDGSGQVTALDVSAASAKRVWTVRAGTVSYGSVVTAGNGRLYTTADSSLVAIDDHGATGSIAWSKNPRDDITEVSAGLAPDGTAILGTNGTREWGYRADGTVAWNAARTITYSSPAVTAGGLAYVGDHQGNVTVLKSADGTLEARYHVGSTEIWSAPVIDQDYDLYVSGQNGHVYGLAADGTVMFDLDVGAAVDSYPALTANGLLLVGSTDGTLSAIG